MLHRVVNKSGQAGYSCPFFYDAPVSLNVKPLRLTGEPKIKAINFGEFLKKNLVPHIKDKKNFFKVDIPLYNHYRVCHYNVLQLNG